MRGQRADRAVEGAPERLTEHGSGYYLRWDTDHTERALRPVYPVDAEQAAQFNVYRIEFENDKPQAVCFFASMKPSNRSDFGAHCIKFHYQAGVVDREFYDVAGKRVNNAHGVHTVRYVFDGQPYATKRQNLDQSGQLVEDASGSAEYYFWRDAAGRRNREIRKDAQGKVVPEHNGFYEARFTFDRNDYATARLGFDESGRPMEGKYGYAGAYFWFDANGNFEKEEFRNAAGDPVLGPKNFASIEYKHIDAQGNWHEVQLFDVQGALLTEAPAILRAKYHANATRASISYFNGAGDRAENDRGIHRYEYQYEDSGVSRQAYSLRGERVQQ